MVRLVDHEQAAAEIVRNGIATVVQAEIGHRARLGRGGGEPAGVLGRQAAFAREEAAVHEDHRSVREPGLQRQDRPVEAHDRRREKFLGENGRQRVGRRLQVARRRRCQPDGDPFVDDRDAPVVDRRAGLAVDAGREWLVVQAGPRHPRRLARAVAAEERRVEEREETGRRTGINLAAHAHAGRNACGENLLGDGRLAGGLGRLGAQVPVAAGRVGRAAGVHRQQQHSGLGEEAT